MEEGNWTWFLGFRERCRGGKVTAADWTSFVQRLACVLFRGIDRGLGHARRSDSDRPSQRLDILQEALWKLMRKDARAIRNFNGLEERQLIRFMQRAGENAARDDRRREDALRRPSLELLLDRAWCCESDSSSGNRRELAVEWVTAHERLQLRERVCLALEALWERVPARNRARYRLVFRLHFGQSLSPEQIARIPAIGLTPNGVWTVITRLRNRFAREYARVVAREDRSRSRSRSRSRKARSGSRKKPGQENVSEG